MRHATATLALAACTALTLALQACAPPGPGFDHPGTGLPTFADAPLVDTLDTMRQRDAALTSWRLQGSLELEDARGSVRLDAVLLADRLDTPAPRLRLRASKLGRTSLDVVADGREAWLWAPDRDGPASPDQAWPANPWTQLRPLAGDSPQRLRTTPAHFVVVPATADGSAGPSEAWVHRATRTLHRLVWDTPDGPVSLDLRYRPAQPAPALDALQLHTPTGRTMRLRVDDFESNPTLTDAQFAPVPGSRPLHTAPDPEGRP